ncbi:putative transporter [Serratia plymuthica]|uniref:Putative transporter n=1 Tax=Serratia plymuthica TaxID=82996 RepID=A0A2X4TNL4_SERPL|nr:putative transporter [Serratia plymuthica]
MLVGGVVAAGVHKLFAVPLPIILGVFSGAVTNTPALGAGQQILTDLGSDPALVDRMGMGYAMAYPFGICGILLVMWLIRLFFRINIDKEAQAFENSLGNHHELLHTMNVAVRNPNLQGMAIKNVPLLNGEDIVCSRLKRGELLMVPEPLERLELGDYLHLVGKRESLENARLVIGEEVDVSLSTRGTALQVVRAVVTNEKVLGSKIRDLNLKRKYDVVISRLNRSGLNWWPAATLRCNLAISSTWLAGRNRLKRSRPSSATLSRNCNRCRCCRYLSASGWECCWVLSRCLYRVSRRHCALGWPAGRWWRH